MKVMMTIKEIEEEGADRKEKKRRSSYAEGFSPADFMGKHLVIDGRYQPKTAIFGWGGEGG